MLCDLPLVSLTVRVAFISVSSLTCVLTSSADYNRVTELNSLNSQRARQSVGRRTDVIDLTEEEMSITDRWEGTLLYVGGECCE